MKPDLQTFDQVLDYAIDRETEAEALYRGWATWVTDATVRGILEEFAEEEHMHQDKLAKVRAGQRALLTGRPAPRFRTPLAVPDVPPCPDMSLAEALALAIKKEKTAYRFYLDMAVDAPSEALMELFLAMAREEANHKVRFEIEYDDLMVPRSWRSGTRGQGPGIS